MAMSWDGQKRFEQLLAALREVGVMPDGSKAVDYKVKNDDDGVIVRLGNGGWGSASCTLQFDKDGMVCEWWASGEGDSQWGD